MGYKLELEKEELNLILSALGQLKYVESANMINKIQISLKGQIEEGKKEEGEDKKEPDGD